MVSNEFNSIFSTVHQHNNTGSAVSDTNCKLPPEEKDALRRVSDQEGISMSLLLRLGWYIMKNMTPKTRQRMAAKPEDAWDILVRYISENY